MQNCPEGVPPLSWVTSCLTFFKGNAFRLILFEDSGYIEKQSSTCVFKSFHFTYNGKCLTYGEARQKDIVETRYEIFSNFL